jgi:hypothetical protein
MGLDREISMIKCINYIDAQTTLGKSLEDSRGHASDALKHHPVFLLRTPSDHSRFCDKDLVLQTFLSVQKVLI